MSPIRDIKSTDKRTGETRRNVVCSDGRITVQYNAMI